MHSAIIIVSEDSLFVSLALFKLKEDYIDAIVERAIGIEDFEILINDLNNQGIYSIQVICDGDLSINEVSEMEDIIDKYANEIAFNISKSWTEYNEVYEY
jgi:hypothetical protein